MYKGRTYRWPEQSVMLRNFHNGQSNQVSEISPYRGERDSLYRAHTTGSTNSLLDCSFAGLRIRVELPCDCKFSSRNPYFSSYQTPRLISPRPGINVAAYASRSVSSQTGTLYQTRSSLQHLMPPPAVASALFSPDASLTALFRRGKSSGFHLPVFWSGFG